MRQLIPRHKIEWLLQEAETFPGGRPALARDYGFDSWELLEAEVEFRRILDECEIAQLRSVLAADPDRATAGMHGWCDHPGAPAPLSYVAMMRYNTLDEVWRDVPGAVDLARALLDAGAPVDGEPGACETPLMTAASYGDAAVARLLIDAGADIEAVAGPDSGGVPNGTALRHAAVFGMTAVLDLLVAAGAQVGSLSQAAAVGDISSWLTDGSPLPDKISALVMAADHERLDVIDHLLAAGTPIDGTDPWGRQPLRQAMNGGKQYSVAYLLQRGAKRPSL